MLNNMKIGVKIASGLTMTTLLAIIIGIAGYMIIDHINDQIDLSKAAHSIKHTCLETSRQGKNYIISKEEIDFKVWMDDVNSIGTIITNAEKLTDDSEVQGWLREGLKVVEHYKNLAHKTHKLVLEEMEIDSQTRNAGRKVEAHLRKSVNSEASITALLNARREEKNLIIYGDRPLHQGEKGYLQKWKDEIGKIENRGIADEGLKKLIVNYSDLISRRVKGLEQLGATTHKLEMVSRSLLMTADNILDKNKKAVLKAQNRGEMLIIFIMGIVVLAAGAMTFFITRTITRPIAKSVNFAETLSRGDFTETLDIRQKDEIGVLVKALNNMVSSLGNMFKKVAIGVGTLSTSSAELSAISQQMSSGAENTHAKSNVVAAAAEEMSANMTSVAAATEQASTNVTMVASATEELTATVNEIARNSDRASAITHKAVSEADSASETVNELGKAAREIDKITEVITEISEQTNLLALNATIEAARAGEAGRGFSVVASEIKELAKQTAEATQKIKREIGGIQDSTEGTVSQIKQISKVINEVDEIVSTTAAAVEEQSVTTKEIATNVAQASQGIQEITENVAQSAVVAGEIAKDIAGVHQASEENVTSSSQVSISAEELHKLAKQLKDMAGRFKI